MSAAASPPIGVILAGGESRRYGSPKALAEVGGRRIIDRAIEGMGAVVDDLLIIANEPDLFADLNLPTMPDARPGLGALGGLHAALLAAQAARRPGVLTMACDMPFPPTALLRRLRDECFGASGSQVPDAVVPESRGRRGIEPLLGAYRVSCLPAIEKSLDEGDRRMIGFHEETLVRRVPLTAVEALCDPERAFLNVNTPEDRERAERLVDGVQRERTS